MNTHLQHNKLPLHRLTCFTNINRHHTHQSPLLAYTSRANCTNPT